MPTALRPYLDKRDFAITSEPKGGVASKAGRLSFVVQKHAASHLHYDFRLELDGTLKSWAVPKGPSLDPADKRMAVHVEDHPIEYGRFEGEIPKGQYGAGSVIVWDNGTWQPIGDARAGYRAGKLKFVLHGKKLSGGWTLVRMHSRAESERHEPWLLIKERDAAARPAAQYSVVDAEPGSVLSKRTIANPPARAAKPATKEAARTKASAAGKPAAAKASAALHRTATARASAKAAPAKAAAAAKTAQAAKTAATSAKSAKAHASGETTVEGMRISHPERVIDASSGITKLDVVNYYLDAARLILPHLAGRPVSLVRAPAGLGGQIVFQRHAGTLHIPGLKELPRSVAPELPPMLEVDSFEALIGAAQANVIEFHTWNASKTKPTQPDRMILDLDPGEGVAWKQVQESTELTRAFLAEIGLLSFLKTSGGKGLHVVVPIAPKNGWDAVRALARRIVEHLAEALPDRIVAKSGPKNRVGKIFVDYLRNGFGATTASAWSARARPGLGVSVPCEWSELGSVSGGAHWTIRNVHERIEDRGEAWRDYAKATRQTIAKAMASLGVEADGA
jgi:bifunctional non-homologous end joining protein LigD